MTYTADEWFQIGVEKSETSLYKEAIEAFDHAIRIDPNLSEAYSNRGFAKSELRDKKAAIADFDRAILIGSNNVGAYVNRNLAKSESSEAIAAGNYTISGTPPDRLSKSDLEDSIADIQGSLIRSYLVLAYLGRGIAKSGLGDKKAAIFDYDQAILIDPNCVDGYNNRGNVKFDLGDKKAAIADYN